MASRFDRGVWLRRARNAAIAIAGLLLIVGVAGFFVLPGVVKSVAEKQIAEQLGRKASIGDVRLNPYRLSATIDDFRLYEPDGTSVAVAVRTLFADISSASLWKRALVFDELRIVEPTIRVARLAAERFSFSDVVDRLAGKPKSESPFLFSVNNIQLDGGVIDVDDRVTNRRHRVDGIRVALPFLSNLPYDTAIFVTPAFAARVDGSAIALTGKAQPFSTTREAAVELDVADLDVTEYVDLSPMRLPFTLASGKLAATLALRFNAAATDADGKMVPQSMSISGRVGLASVDLTDKAGRSAIKAKAIDVDVAKIDPFSGDVLLERVRVTDPQVDATRRADGSIDLVDLFRIPPSGPAASAPPPATTGAAAAPATTGATAAPAFGIAAFEVDNASVRFVDQALPTPATTQLKNVSVDARGIALKGAAPTTFKVALAADDDARFEVAGTVLVEKREASGTIGVKRFRPARIAPYLASALAARIDEGSVDVDARFRIDASGPRLLGLVDEIGVRVDRLRTSLPDEKTALLGADGIVLDGGRFDLASREFSADSLKLVAPVVAIRRDAKGQLNLKAALVEASPSGPASASKAAVKVEPEAARPFTAVIKSLSVERGDVAFEDLSVGTPVRVRAQPLNLKAENIGTSAAAVVPFALDAGIDKRGKLTVDGRVALNPMTVDATVDVSQVAIGWLAAYSGNRLNIMVERADLDAKGTVRVAGPKGGAADTTPLAVSYRGSLGIGRMRALDKTTSEEFMQWKTLEIPRVEVEMPAKNAPLAVTLGNVTLSDFYARVIVNANGRLNLQDVVAAPGRQQSVTTPEAQPTAAPEPAAGARVVPPGKPSSEPTRIRVAGVKLAKGRIGITDNFIKPNYSANLTDLGGEISSIASDDAKPADVRLTGRIDGEGVLEVGGSINPFATTLYTDLSATAKDIELTRLTPYAVKYAGYAIERGKMSMTVKYHIEDGRLDAENRLFLDQLTFGEKVDSPTATKLPVLLAVSLLKNSRGEIDVNLPVSGSLTDPEFSIGGVLARVLVNLLTRALTSPFSLIAAAVGGGGSGAGELGYVQFQPGVSEMTAEGKAKLETLAKALAERPAVKLDVIGRFDPATDPDGIKRDHLLDHLKDLKAKDQSKAGDPVGRNEVTIEPNEYATWLARVYDDTKLPDKPRNVVGFAKTLPVDEMERLLLANIKLDDNDPRWLAEARADVVRHYIEDTGKVPASRVFLVTPRLDARGISDGGAASRVDFALR